MTKSYNVSGMKCGGCETSIKNALSSISDITGVEIKREEGKATVEMNSDLEVGILQEAIGKGFVITEE